VYGRLLQRGRWSSRAGASARERKREAACLIAGSLACLVPASCSKTVSYIHRVPAGVLASAATAATLCWARAGARPRGRCSCVQRREWCSLLGDDSQQSEGARHKPHGRPIDGRAMGPGRLRDQRALSGRGRRVRCAAVGGRRRARFQLCSGGALSRRSLCAAFGAPPTSTYRPRTADRALEPATEQATRARRLPEGTQARFASTRTQERRWKGQGRRASINVPGLARHIFIPTLLARRVGRRVIPSAAHLLLSLKFLSSAGPFTLLHMAARAPAALPFEC
jgi:hypothetical protein